MARETDPVPLSDVIKGSAIPARILDLTKVEQGEAWDVSQADLISIQPTLDGDAGTAVIELQDSIDSAKYETMADAISLTAMTKAINVADVASVRIAVKTKDEATPAGKVQVSAYIYRKTP